jgi:hypothetical protein
LLKNYFIPHKGNNHQPHLLRKRAVLAVLVTLLLIEAVFLVQILVVWPLTGIFSSILPGVLVDLTNGSRSQNNIASLKVNSLLQQAALLKARDMAAKGYFAHTSPEGVEPWYWLQQVGYSYSGAGENLAINFSDSADIANAWMNSSGHRANILDNRFSEIGIAATSGFYQGKETVFVVQFFGRPQVQAVQSPAPTKAPAPSASAIPTLKPSLQATLRPTILPSPSMNSGQSPSVAPQVIAVVNQPDTIFTASGTVASAVEQNQGIQSATPTKAPFLQRLVSMPKTLTDTIYIAIAAIFLLALALKIFIKINVQYPRLIFNGVIVLFVVISLLYLNHLIAGQGQIFY